MVPDVTGTKQHTEQMFVVDTYSKNRIFRATKRNIKHEGASPLKRGHICTNHGEPETLQGTPEHEWAGKAQTARRPGK